MPSPFGGHQVPGARVLAGFAAKTLEHRGQVVTQVLEPLDLGVELDESAGEECTGSPCQGHGTFGSSRVLNANRILGGEKRGGPHVAAGAVPQTSPIVWVRILCPLTLWEMSAVTDLQEDSGHR